MYWVNGRVAFQVKTFPFFLNLTGLSHIIIVIIATESIFHLELFNYVYIYGNRVHKEQRFSSLIFYSSVGAEYLYCAINFFSSSIIFQPSGSHFLFVSGSNVEFFPEMIELARLGLEAGKGNRHRD